MDLKNLFRQHFITILTVVLVLFTVCSCCQFNKDSQPTTQTSLSKTIINEVNSESEERNNYEQQTNRNFADFNIPQYSQQPFITLNNNIPWFNESDKITVAFEKYSELDNHGRCGVAFVCVCREIMPIEERGEIGNIKPSGWHTVKYDIVDGKYLYNRCHLVGYQLSGENANPQNLITGTRYLNIEGMLPFENMVSEYVENTGNHVLYRVTPLFEDSNLLSRGVVIEAYSIEDNGEGICFNVFCYNVQPGIIIDYSTGASYVETLESEISGSLSGSDNADYIVNINTSKFHYPHCSSVQEMKDKNKREYIGTREELVELGYSPCKRCNP